MDGSQPEPPDEFCTACGARIPGRGRFCPNCGSVKPSMRRPDGWTANVPGVPPVPSYAWQPHMVAQPRKRPSWRVVVKGVMAALMLTYVAYLLVTVGVLIYGVGIVLPVIGNHQYTLYALLPLLTPLLSISGAAFETYYLLIVAAIIASVGWVALSSLKGFTEEVFMKAESRRHSALFDVCGIFFGILFFDLALAFFMTATGYEPSDPTEESSEWQLLFSLANASVWEELVARVLLIGVPLFFIDLFRHRSPPKPHKYLLGGGFSFGLVEVVLVIVSAGLFGLAHYDAWGAWKILPSAIAGLGFGYLFLRHGLAAAIVLHFAFDYMSMPMTVFPDSLGLTVALVVGILLWAGLGLVFFGYYVIRMLEFVTAKKYLEERPQLVGAPLPFQYTYAAGEMRAPETFGPKPSAQNQGNAQTWQNERSVPIGGYVCPICGHTQARWAEGRFHCMRCGHSS